VLSLVRRVSARLGVQLGLFLFFSAAVAFTSPQKILPIGIWQTEGYGFVFDVGPDRITEFDTLGNQCLLHMEMKPDTFSGNFGDWTRGDGGTWYLIVSGMTVKRLDKLPTACANTSRDPDDDPLRNFDYLWNTFNTHYAFFSAHNVDWNEVRKKYRPQVMALPKGGDPFPIFAEMLALLKDTHVHLSDGKRNAHVRKYPDVKEMGPQGAVLLDDHYLQSHLVDYLRGNNTPLDAPANSAGNGQVWYGRLKPRVQPGNSGAKYGYVTIFAMDRFGKKENDDTPIDVRLQSVDNAMNEVISSFRGVKGAIVDLRYNGGGEEVISLAIAGHFTDAQRPVWTKRAHEKGKTHIAFPMELHPSAGERLAVPVIVLTSDFTVSAAETATMALRALPSTIQIGQATRGVLSDKLEKVLPNRWNVSLSNEIYVDPEGEVFEVRGVPPDVTTAFPPLKAPDEERFGRDIFLAMGKLSSSEK
jgi:carboxyl-terminal processing protease